MKKIILSTVTIATIAMTGSYADTTSDIVAMKVMVKEMNQRLVKLETENRNLKIKNKTASLKKSKHAVLKKSVKKEEEPKITLIRKNSPEFLLGKETHINMKFVPQDASDMWFKAGVRIQGTMESKTIAKPGKEDTTINDAYLRRVRLEVAAGFGEHASFVMDIRNDKSNHGIENDEGNFNVGDAYLKIKKPFDTSLLNFALYRAKIDVSRTETVKSARVVVYDRPYIADYAAQYISFNRRGTNVQMYGDWNKKIHYQVAMGAASSPDKALDAAGVKGSSVDIDLQKQSYFYGGKIIFSPFDGWEEKLKTETYFAEGKHFSVGAGYWAVPEMKGTANTSAGEASFDLNRKLLNIEASMHYGGLFLQGEYFKFDDVVKDWAVSGAVETGTSDGWYVTGEYVMPELSYLAPYFRYETWDRLNDADGYDVTSKTLGLNWYLRGNTTKIGLLYQQDEYGVNTGNRTDDIIRVTSQWFF